MPSKAVSVPSCVGTASDDDGKMVNIPATFSVTQTYALNYLSKGDSIWLYDIRGRNMLGSTEFNYIAMRLPFCGARYDSTTGKYISGWLFCGDKGKAACGDLATRPFDPAEYPDWIRTPQQMNAIAALLINADLSTKRARAIMQVQVWCITSAYYTDSDRSTIGEVYEPGYITYNGRRYIPGEQERSLGIFEDDSPTASDETRILSNESLTCLQWGQTPVGTLKVGAASEFSPEYTVTPSFSGPITLQIAPHMPLLLCSAQQGVTFNNPTLNFASPTTARVCASNANKVTGEVTLTASGEYATTLALVFRWSYDNGCQKYISYEREIAGNVRDSATIDLPTPTPVCATLGFNSGTMIPMPETNEVDTTVAIDGGTVVRVRPSSADMTWTYTPQTASVLLIAQYGSAVWSDPDAYDMQWPDEDGGTDRYTYRTQSNGSPIRPTYLAFCSSKGTDPGPPTTCADHGYARGIELEMPPFPVVGGGTDGMYESALWPGGKGFAEAWQVPVPGAEFFWRSTVPIHALIVNGVITTAFHSGPGQNPYTVDYTSQLYTWGPKGSRGDGAIGKRPDEPASAIGPIGVIGNPVRQVLDPSTNKYVTSYGTPQIIHMCSNADMGTPTTTRSVSKVATRTLRLPHTKSVELISTISPVRSVSRVGTATEQQLATYSATLYRTVSSSNIVTTTHSVGATASNPREASTTGHASGTASLELSETPLKNSSTTVGASETITLSQTASSVSSLTLETSTTHSNLRTVSSELNRTESATMALTESSSPSQSASSSRSASETKPQTMSESPMPSVTSTAPLSASTSLPLSETNSQHLSPSTSPTESLSGSLTRLLSESITWPPSESISKAHSSTPDRKKTPSIFQHRSKTPSLSLVPPQTATPSRTFKHPPSCSDLGYGLNVTFRVGPNDDSQSAPFSNSTSYLWTYRLNFTWSIIPPPSEVTIVLIYPRMHYRVIPRAVLPTYPYSDDPDDPNQGRPISISFCDTAPARPIPNPPPACATLGFSKSVGFEVTSINRNESAPLGQGGLAWVATFDLFFSWGVRPTPGRVDIIVAYGSESYDLIESATKPVVDYLVDPTNWTAVLRPVFITLCTGDLPSPPPPRINCSDFGLPLALTISPPPHGLDRGFYATGSWSGDLGTAWVEQPTVPGKAFYWRSDIPIGAIIVNDVIQYWAKPPEPVSWAMITFTQESYTFVNATMGDSTELRGEPCGSTINPVRYDSGFTPIEGSNGTAGLPWYRTFVGFPYNITFCAVAPETTTTSTTGTYLPTVTDGQNDTTVTTTVPSPTCPTCPTLPPCMCDPTPVHPNLTCSAIGFDHSLVTPNTPGSYGDDTTGFNVAWYLLGSVFFTASMPVGAVISRGPDGKALTGYTSLIPLPIGLVHVPAAFSSLEFCYKPCPQCPTQPPHTTKSDTSSSETTTAVVSETTMNTIDTTSIVTATPTQTSRRPSCPTGCCTTNCSFEGGAAALGSSASKLIIVVIFLLSSLSSRRI